MQRHPILLMLVLRQLRLLRLQGRLAFFQASELLLKLVERGPAAVHHGATAVYNRLFRADVLPQAFALLLRLGDGKAV
ncbi:MAG: hypothetical protein H6657_29420 [Ardenticatenaceae bacterium]|nr:hypothetical protein [Ardenticatenaceae bacterium]